MKKIFQREAVGKALSQSRYRELLEQLPAELFLIQYETGEFLPHPEKDERLLQIVVEGAVSIYYIRDDGSSYSLALSQRDEILGSMEFFGNSRNNGVFAEVTQDLTCLAFSVAENKNALMKNADLLRMLAESLANIVETLTMQNAAQPSLQERVYSYMLYKCDNKQLRGVEKASFHLHCSPRQLQRILNAFVQDGVAKKIRKGTYELV